MYTWRDNIGNPIEIGKVYQRHIMDCVYFIYVLSFEENYDDIETEIIHSRIAHGEVISSDCQKIKMSYRDVMISTESKIFDYHSLVEEFTGSEEFKELIAVHTFDCI